MGNNRYCLTKADLADAIYAALPVDKQKAAQVVEDYIEIIKDALEKHGKVMLSGFGSYEVKYKPPPSWKKSSNRGLYYSSGTESREIQTESALAAGDQWPANR